MYRFCSKEYEPFDASDINKYVITDDYTPLWEVSSRKEIGFGHCAQNFRGSIDPIEPPCRCPSSVGPLTAGVCRQISCSSLFNNSVLCVTIFASLLRCLMCHLFPLLELTSLAVQFLLGFCSENGTETARHATCPGTREAAGGQDSPRRLMTV